MIIKSYEILKNILKFLDYNLFLFYGENEGLKKDIVENIKANPTIVSWFTFFRHFSGKNFKE